MLLALGLMLPALAQAEPVPPDAGIVNVRDFGARGDGKADDTAAILKAIAASGGDTGRSFWQDKIVYLPDGIYRISDTLLKRYANGGYASGLTLMGQSRDRTIIRLADGAAGFGDAGNPRAIIFTTSKLLDGNATSGGKNYPALGEGNDAYMNGVEDITIDAGAGNPGAIGIDYLANNIGAIRHVTLRASTGSGAVGLSMRRKWPGPAMIRDLAVQGFATGIATAQTEYGLTFEKVRLDGQSGAGLVNNQNALTFRGLSIRNTPLAIANPGPLGMVAVDDGQVPRLDDLKNAGVMVLRGVQAGGRRMYGVLEGPRWTAMPAGGELEGADAPEPARDPVQGWANITRFGAVADPAQDSTEAFRKAFASGASTIYLPNGTYAISDALVVPASVRRIVGFHSTLKILAARKPGFSRTGGMLRVLEGGVPLQIERLTFDNTNLGQQLAIEHAGARDLVIQDVVAAGVTLLDRKESGGRAFLENVCCGRMQVAGPAPVYARQFDTEGGGVRITNLGTPLWILGLKTEGITTVVDNHAGAQTRIFGGLIYMVRPGQPLPAFVNNGGRLSASFVEESLRPSSRYQVYLSGQQGDVAADTFPARGLGRFVPALRSGD